MELICCVCGKVKRNDSWQELKPAPGIPLSHGYCPKCAEEFMAKYIRPVKETEAKLAVA